MAQQLTPQRVEEEIRRLSRVLGAKVDELPALFQKAAESDTAYRVEYAKVLLRSDYSRIAEREAEATVHCERLLLARNIDQAVADAAKESTRAVRDQLNAVQSVGAMLRAEMGFSQRGVA